MLRNRSDHLYYQQPTHTPQQRHWLTEKYAIFKEHHDRKTLGLFFPPLYEEYFTLWPATPTAENVEAAGGRMANAVSNIRRVEEHVRVFRDD